MGLDGAPRVPHHGAFRRAWPPFSQSKGKKTRQSSLCLFSLVVPKDDNNSAILFQKDCLSVFHIVGETAGLSSRKDFPLMQFFLFLKASLL